VYRIWTNIVTNLMPVVGIFRCFYRKYYSLKFISFLLIAGVEILMSLCRKYCNMKG